MSAEVYTDVTQDDLTEALKHEETKNTHTEYTEEELAEEARKVLIIGLVVYFVVCFVGIYYYDAIYDAIYPFPDDEGKEYEWSNSAKDAILDFKKECGDDGLEIALRYFFPSSRDANLGIMSNAMKDHNMKTYGKYTNLEPETIEQFIQEAKDLSPIKSTCTFTHSNKFDTYDDVAKHYLQLLIRHPEYKQIEQYIYRHQGNNHIKYYRDILKIAYSKYNLVHLQQDIVNYLNNAETQQFISTCKKIKNGNMTLTELFNAAKEYNITWKGLNCRTPKEFLLHKIEMLMKCETHSSKYLTRYIVASIIKIMINSKEYKDIKTNYEIFNKMTHPEKIHIIHTQILTDQDKQDIYADLYTKKDDDCYCPDNNIKNIKKTVNEIIQNIMSGKYQHKIDSHDIDTLCKQEHNKRYVTDYALHQILDKNNQEIFSCDKLDTKEASAIKKTLCFITKYYYQACREDPDLLKEILHKSKDYEKFMLSTAKDLWSNNYDNITI